MEKRPQVMKKPMMRFHSMGAGRRPRIRGAAYREGIKEKGTIMKEEARSSVPRRMAMLVALAVVAVLSLGLLAACGSNGSGSSGGGGAAATDETTMTTKTLVKTAANELALVDWDVTDADSPLTISSDDPKYVEYVEDLSKLTGYNIESLTMQVSITTVQGAEIGATHEFTYENTYTVDSLEAVVDSKTITYKDGDFK